MYPRWFYLILVSRNSLHTVKLKNHLGHTSNIFHLSSWFWSLSTKIWIILLKNIVQKLRKQSRIETQPDHWKLVLDPYASKVKSLGFPPFFVLHNRVWLNQEKSWKWVMFKTLLCQPTWFQMYVLYTIWKYTWSAMILAKKNFKIQNSYFA